MPFTPPSQTAAAEQRIKHAQASPQQLSHALIFVQQELQDMFFPLKWTTWVNALLTVQPDLWVRTQAGQETVYFDAQGLALMARDLATQPDGADSSIIIDAHHHYRRTPRHLLGWEVGYIPGPSRPCVG